MRFGSQLTVIGSVGGGGEEVVPLVQELQEAHDLDYFSIGSGIGIIYEDALVRGERAWREDQPEETRPILRRKLTGRLWRSCWHLWG